MPETPHVFWAETIHCVEPPEEIRRLKELLAREYIDVPTTRVRVDNREVQSIVFRDVMVMVGHGIRLGDEEHQWVFRGTKASVSDTVAAYNRVAKDVFWRPVDVVVCCREEGKNPEPHNSLVTFDFHQGDVCVYPDSLATIKNHPKEASMIPGSGAWMVAEASKWRMITWFRTQDKRVTQWILRARSVPDWATMLVP